MKFGLGKGGGSSWSANLRGNSWLNYKSRAALLLFYVVLVLLRFTFCALVHTGQTLEVVTEVVAFCESQMPEGAALRCEHCLCTVGELAYLYPDFCPSRCFH